MAKGSGGAAPITAEIESGEEIGDDIVASAAKLMNKPLAFPAGEATPAAKKPATPAKKPATAATAEDDDFEMPGEKAERLKREAADAAAASGETDEEKAAREAEEADAGETPEAKTAREAEEAAAAAEETDEEKAAREAEEAAADTPEAQEAQALADGTKKFVDLRLKDLPDDVRERVQGVIQSRLGFISVAAKAEKARLETVVEELTDKLEVSEKNKAPTEIPGLNPLYMANNEAELDQRLKDIREFRVFVRDNPDGVPEDAATGRKEWTPAAMQKRLWELEDERDSVIPAVRLHLQQRAALDEPLKKSFPSLFDRKSEDYRAREALLKQMPELRRHANMNVLVARLLLGAKVLADRSKPKSPAAAAGSAGSEPRRAPRVPGSGGPGRGSVIAGSQAGGKPAISTAMNRVMANPGDKKAFNQAVEALVSDML